MPHGGVLKAAGDDIQLTPRGEALLKTGDPEEVSDWLLTRILGFDNVLHRLREGPAKPDQLGSMLQEVNPGWTTRFAPDVLGRKSPMDSRKIADGERKAGDGRGGHPRCRRPHRRSQATRTFRCRCSACRYNGIFAAQTVAALDVGLWLHSRRHFAVLTGLSGAGKTLLARSYGRALWSGPSQLDEGTLVLPVQPGWQDPSPLLGYVNPLSQSIYVRPQFLDFLLAAAGDPGRPYTVVLDEMNLSHPE